MTISNARSLIRNRHKPSQRFDFVASLVVASKSREAVVFQDAKSQIYVCMPAEMRTTLIDEQVGCLVRVMGSIVHQTNLPTKLVADSFEIIDPDHRIQAVPAKIEASTPGTPLNRLGFTDVVIKELMISDGRTLLYMNGNGENRVRGTLFAGIDLALAKQWMNKKARVKGCVTKYLRNNRDKTRHDLLMMHPSQIELAKTTKTIDTPKPPRPVASIAIHQTPVCAVTLEGLVAFSDNYSQVAVIEQGKCYLVKTQFADRILVGQRIAIEGKNAWNHSCNVHVINSCIIRTIGSGNLPPTLSITPEKLLARADLPTSVRTTARVERLLFKDQICKVFLRDGDLSFRALVALPTEPEKEESSFMLQPESLIEVIGVPVRRYLTDANNKRRAVVAVMVASPDQVTVIEDTFFLSPSQAKWIAGSIAFVFLFVLLWIYSLRQQVDARTKSLARMSNRMQTAFEVMHEAILITNSQGDVVQVNPRFEKIFGFEPATGGRFHYSLPLLRQRIAATDFVACTDAISPHSDTQISGTPENLAFPIEVKHDGNVTHIQFHRIAIRSHDGEPCGQMFVFDDVTEQRDLNAKLTQAQKMEAVGRLSGGIAHDFNNFLSVISSSLAAYLHERGQTDVQRLEPAKIAVDRASKLTQQLLGFARRSRLKRNVVSVSDMIQGVAGLLAGLIESPVQFITQLPTQDLFLDIDVNRMEQVLINLCLNAYDEVDKETGVITLSARTVTAPDGVRSILLSVGDNGPGIPTKVQPYVFEPFYTTKDVGEGTGLGLSVAQGVVEQHGGVLQFETSQETGTQFQVILPAADGPANSDQPLLPSPGLPKQLRILLVDDDQLVRDSLAARLSSQSHHVVAVENGMQAIRSLAEDPGYDLILLDLIMPEMSGWETYQEIRSAWPDHRVVFCSGYSQEYVQRQAVADQELPEVISKPFISDELDFLLASV